MRPIFRSSVVRTDGQYFFILSAVATQAVTYIFSTMAKASLLPKTASARPRQSNFENVEANSLRLIDHQYDEHARRAPVNNAGYWRAKRLRNAARDRRNLRRLRRDGWRVLTIWECQMKDPEKLRQRLRAFLQG
jgi:hypothetical protein